MAQRPTRGDTPVQKPNPLPQEEDSAEKSQEKPQTQGTIAVMKSKIREKDVPRQEEESLAGTRVSPSKITSKVKKHKRGSSAENPKKEDAAVIEKLDARSEKLDLKLEEDNAKFDVEPKLEPESKLEENPSVLPETKSKKSVAKIVLSKKSLSLTEDEQTEDLQPKKSEIKGQVESFISTDAVLYKTVSSVQESQEQRFESQNVMKNIQSDLSQSAAKKSFAKPVQQQRIERKSYLANLSPEPLEEYPTDEEDPKEAKDQEKTN